MQRLNHKNLIVENAHGEPCGRDPRKVPIAELNAAGHFDTPLLDVIREKCKDCVGHTETQSQVRDCIITNCPSWPYRMGTNPLRKRDKRELTEAEEEKMRERMEKMHAALAEKRAAGKVAKRPAP